MSGKNQKQSALYAGCPAASADVSASRYERHPEIIALLSRMTAAEKPKEKTVKAEKVVPAAKAIHEPEPTQKPPAPPPEVFQKTPVAAVAIEMDSDDLPAPLRFMRDVMNDVQEDPKLRLDAAKALAAFTVAKPGEKGKKELKQEEAEKVASRFAPSAPPKLVAAGGRKV